MKKFLAVLLSVCLLLAVAAPAMGENVYSIVRSYLYSEDGCNLGFPTATFSGTWEDDLLFVFANMNDNVIYLGGTNADGKKETCVWPDIEFETALLTLIKLCMNWENIEGILESGYTMGYIFAYGEDKIFITSKAEADNFVATIMQMITQE